MLRSSFETQVFKSMILFKVLKREEFEARKQAAEASRLSKRSQQKYEPDFLISSNFISHFNIQYYHSCVTSVNAMYTLVKNCIYVTDNLLINHQDSV